MIKSSAATATGVLTRTTVDLIDFPYQTGKRDADVEDQSSIVCVKYLYPKGFERLDISSLFGFYDKDNLVPHTPVDTTKMK